MANEVVDVALLQQLADDLGGDPEPVKDLIRTFVAETPKTLKRLEDAIARNDAAGVALAAHSLKAPSLLLGAVQLSDAAKDLETMGRSGTLTDAAPKGARVKTLFGEVATQLLRWPSD